ncbi:hypothetical protein C4D60_Mb11t04750 [Musa balbisiana]|uniref:Cytochrome c oxidase subunit 5C n=1 Tax=Musa balbisiana TaxID=52838 RepID=A0A4S8J1W0_MUSBA|nr:hypothetical protein C4D60_Mb11t04750 [Musa balbisiana]
MKQPTRVLKTCVAFRNRRPHNIRKSPPPPPRSLLSAKPIVGATKLTSSSHKMAAHKIAHATLKGPSVVKEICIGLTLGLFAGGLWKMHHWNEQRKTRAFYDMLEKGEISN